MHIPKISRVLFRMFNVPSEAQQLINKSLGDRKNLPAAQRKDFVFQAKQYRSNWRVLAVWGLMVTFTDHPEKLLFVFFIPAWVCLNIIGHFFG